ISEAIWRLLRAGEQSVDVGANCGYMTALMAKRVGISGKVSCFEPHPDLLSELSYNLGLWHKVRDVAKIELHGIALSNSAGIGVLRIPEAFSRNRGLATLTNDWTTAEAKKIEVQLATLDEIF